jgi:rod shape-determining protein MreD
VNDDRTPIDYSRAWRKSVLFLGALVLAALALQTSRILRLPATEVRPDVLLALVYYFARYEGSVPGMLLGFMVGLLEDVSNPDAFGIGTLAKCTVGFLTGRYWAGRRIFKENWRAQTLTLFAAVVIHDLVYMLFYTGGHPLGFLALLGRVTLPTAVYTALVCPAVIAGGGWLIRHGPRLHAKLFRLQQQR